MPAVPLPVCSSGTCTTPPFSSRNTGEAEHLWIAVFICCKPLVAVEGHPSSEVAALWGSWSCRRDVELSNSDPVHSEGLNMSVLASTHRTLDTTAQRDPILCPLTPCAVRPARARSSHRHKVSFGVQSPVPHLSYKPGAVSPFPTRSHCKGVPLSEEREICF